MRLSALSSGTCCPSCLQVHRPDLYVPPVTEGVSDATLTTYAHELAWACMPCPPGSRSALFLALRACFGTPHLYPPRAERVRRHLCHCPYHPDALQATLYQHRSHDVSQTWLKENLGGFQTAASHTPVDAFAFTALQHVYRWLLTMLYCLLYGRFGGLYFGGDANGCRCGVRAMQQSHRATFNYGATSGWWVCLAC